MKNKIILFVVKLLFVTLSFAQNPKYYFPNFEHSTNEPITVYSVDLITGQKEVVFSEDDKIYGVPLVLDDQSRIFFKAQRKICVYNTENQTIDTLSHLGNIERFQSIALVPSTNEIFLGFIKEDAKIVDREYLLLEVTDVSIDKDTYALIDTIGLFGAVDAVLSRDGNKVFQLKETTDGIYFRSFTVGADNFESDSLAIEGFDNLENIYQPYFIDANNGYVFISYINLNETESHFLVCDPEEGKSIYYGKNIKTMRIPPFGEAVTNNGDMIFQDKDNFYVLSHETGKLRKRLKFHFNEPTTDPHAARISQKAKLLIIGDTLYYFPKNPDDWEYSKLWTYEVGSGNINEDQSDESLMDFLLDDINDLYQKGGITNQSTFTKYENYFNNIKSQLQQGQLENARLSLNTVIQDLETDNGNSITKEAFDFLIFNTKAVKDRIPETQQPWLTVKLVDSNNNMLTGGTLKYYEGGWKDAVDNGDGTFKVETERSTVSLRMTYAYGSQTISNVTVSSDTFAFQTVNTTVELRDSENNLITPAPTGEDATVKYYSGGWRDFGPTVNGVASKELLPNNYTFRMSYAYASKDKKQDLNTDPVVIFQTANTEVKLNDSQGNPITEEATVKYYSGGWRDFGTTVNGVAGKELLANNYTFRMNYAFASEDQKQDLNTDPVVIFQTVNTEVKLNDSQGNPIAEEATVKYYSGGWRDFGITVNGVAVKELLPNNYTFRMTYAFASKDKKQDLNTDPVIVFETVNTEVKLNDSQGNPITDAAATVKYYSGGWRDFGTTVNGVAAKELLANNYTFRMTHEFISNDKKQDTGVDNNVVFTTVNCVVRVTDLQSQLLDNAVVRYYSGGWRNLGSTVSGEVAKELLPANLTFRAIYNSNSKDVKQDLSNNNLVEIVIE
ncbi:MAG: hypothetical protein PVH88_05225 [Ignavibacteria bacterium]